MILKLLHSILALLTEASVTEATHGRKFMGKKINKIDSLNKKESPWEQRKALLRNMKCTQNQHSSVPGGRAKK